MPILTATNQAAADAAVNQPIFLVYLDVAGDPVWAWTGHGNLPITAAGDPLLAGGRTFMGTGEIGGVGAITHASDGSVQSMALTLAGADLSSPDFTAFVNDVAAWSQRPAVVWKAFARTVPGSGVLVDPPFRMMTGRMIHVATSNGRQPGIAVKIAARSAMDGQRISNWKLADAHQQAFYPGDRALSFIPQLIGKELRFGVRDNSPSQPTGGATDAVHPRNQGRQLWQY